MPMESKFERVDQRVLVRGARKDYRHPEGMPRSMRARLAGTIVVAIAAMLTVFGGVTHAQGLDSSTSAQEQQYGTPRENPDSAVLGEVGEVEEAAPDQVADTAPTAAAAPEAAAAQPVEQESGELPFTGFATLAVALLGMALLAGGLALRRTARGNS